MKKLYAVAFLILIEFGLKAQTYFQYFDGANTNPLNSIIVTIPTATNNIWQIGKPQKTLFSAASTTPNVIVTDTINYYPTNNLSTFNFIIKNPFIGPMGIIAIRWKQKLDMDQGLDGGFVEYSTNSGASWINTFNNSNVYSYYGFQPANKDTLPSGEYVFSGRDTTWRDIWLCLGPTIFAANDTIMMRFTFKSDSVNNNREGWMIDNMMAYTTIFHPVKQVSQTEYIGVYPTQTAGVVNVEAKKLTDKDAISSMYLIDANGKVVESYGHNSTKVVIDISNHPPGLYYIKVTTNHKTESYPILLQKE